MANTNITKQSTPTAGHANRTDLYTVPAATNTTISSILACNTGTASDEITISVTETGAAYADTQAIYWKVPVPVTQTFTATIGGAVPTGAKIRVSSLNGTINFTAFGVEVS